MLGVIHGDREGEARFGTGWTRPGPTPSPSSSRATVSTTGGRGARCSKKGCVAAVAELEAEGRAIDAAALDALFSYIDLPLEFTSASDYCKRRGARPFPRGPRPVLLESRLAPMDELVSKANLALFCLGGPDRAEARQRAMARLFFEKGMKTFSYTEEMRVRDRHMSGRHRALVGAAPLARVVHICGWQHLCDPFGFYPAFHPKRSSSMIKLFVFDSGNVILPFDNRQIAEKLYARSEAKGACSPATSSGISSIFAAAPSTATKRAFPRPWSFSST